LYLSDTHAVTRRGVPIDINFNVAAPRETLGKRRRYTGHILDRLLNVLCNAVDNARVGSGDFDADGTLDARGQHIDAIANGRNEDIRQPRSFVRSSSSAMSLSIVIPGRH